jgi:Na+/H+ antiporter NhaD/arsenite permease-like protein
MRRTQWFVTAVGVALVSVVGLVELAHVRVGPAPALPVWSAAPFALLLLCIAVLPLVAHHWWENNRNRIVVSFGFAVVAGVYLVAMGPATGGETVRRLNHELAEYASFIILLASLYTVAGGIALTGDVRPRPLTNALILALGAVLSNLIGTTGASVLLIRPFLRINAGRTRVRHIPIFFIFIVSNTGGLLTPLGDPPLFLGFLKGVDFFWTLALWREWLLVNGALLALFLAWDSYTFAKEPRAAAAGARPHEPLRVRGLWPNVPLLAAILAAVLLQSPAFGRLTLHQPWGEAVMVLMLALSLFLTPRPVRDANGFGWGAITEVAVLFVGVFVTMVPALALLETHGPRFGLSGPWQFFWLTGGLSMFLDNAPTYLSFATLAAGDDNLAALAAAKPLLLKAISCGAVFMGANTYIGNGPNFMVKAIAEEMRYKMPTFFGYKAYAAAILLPLFAIVTWVFFV